jgi:uncharacterized protein YaaW (UPF0174 family)
MQDHQRRVVDELRDLKIKIDKLEKFTDSPKLEKINREEASLLVDQLDAMNEYSDILEERVALFKK